MATKQTSKQAKNKAEARVDSGAMNRPGAKSEREPLRRNSRVRSRSAAAPTDRAGATAAAAVHEKPHQARSRSKATAPPADLATAAASGGKQPPASTKRAKLIGMLERAEGASVAEIGQRLGWLPHTGARAPPW